MIPSEDRRGCAIGRQMGGRQMTTSGMKKALIAAAIAGLATPALAHHSAAMFDRDKQVTVQGTVREFQYTNPHSWLLVIVMEPDGKTTEWSFEAEAPSTLLRSGIK